MTLNHDEKLEVKMPKALKEMFTQVCKDRMLNRAEVVRHLLVQFIAEKQEKND